jgi:hypothetical protein
MENQEALNLKKVINRLTKRYDKLGGEISFKFRQLELICIHNDTEIKDDYVPGGYLNRCEYIKRKVCKVCGKVLNEDITYGGFN